MRKRWAEMTFIASKCLGLLGVHITLFNCFPVLSVTPRTYSFETFYTKHNVKLLYLKGILSVIWCFMLYIFWYIRILNKCLTNLLFWALFCFYPLTSELLSDCDAPEHQYSVKG